MNIRRNTLLGCIVLLATICLVVVMAAQEQNVVPATAAQAAKMPQFPSRLTHPASPQTNTRAARRHRLSECSQMHPGSLQDNGIYNNGPTNGLSAPAFGQVIYNEGPIDGNDNAFFVTGPNLPNFLGSVQDVSNGFVAANSGTVGTVEWAGWSVGTPTSFSYSFSTSAFGNELGSGTVALNAGNSTLLFTNGFGYGVYDVTASISGGPTLTAGNTYWLTISNANDASDDGTQAWDIPNGGSGGPAICNFRQSGTNFGNCGLGGESFTLSASSTTTTSNSCMPERSGGFAVIHDFSGSGDGSSPSGVAIDGLGNLYGATEWGGVSGFGTVFKLSQTASSWLISALYTFIGGYNGSYPEGVIVGPQSTLYGAAYGGIQGCPGGYCGLIFDLTPAPTATSVTGLSRWRENVLYSFTGTTDAYQGSGLVSDQAGNLYGVSWSGGAQGQGAVFELTPSIGGWTESILYSFTGGSDGGNPTALLVGNDGTLYGLAGAGGANGSGVVFRLVYSANGWNEAVLSDLPYSMYPTYPGNLLQDSESNLFGEWEYWYEEPEGGGETLGVIFELSPSSGNWIYAELWRGDRQEYTDNIFINLTLDGAGNLWGTGRVVAGCMFPVIDGYIFELARTGDGWQYNEPEHWDQTTFSVSGNLAIDGHGNLYGTTTTCGTQNQGTVWELSATR